MRLISYSLFGGKACYLDGAIWAAAMAPRYYPGWVVRFYVDERWERARRLLSARGCEVVPMPPAEDMGGMWWRILAAADPAAERIIFRDADACLCSREADAVAEWEASGLDAHAMHDDAAHQRPLQGGMWGVRGGVLPNIAEFVDAWPNRTRRGDDENFLAEKVWPLVAGSTLRHSSVAVPWPASPFRLPRVEMIGEQFFRY